MFEKNEGALDRGVRVVVGLGLLGLALTGQTPWGFLGVVPLVAGLIGSCPAYRIFGISTCPMQKRNS